MSSKSKSDSKKKALPAAAIKMAKRMGVNLDGFELEAEEIWKKLDDMAANKPVEYQAFLDQQYTIQLEEEAKKSVPDGTQPEVKGGSDRSATSESADRYFRPENGFAIKVKTTGNDGLKIRSAGEGKTLYINFCHHLALDIPMDAFGTQVINFTSANGLSIPLVVGPIRDLEKSSPSDPLSVSSSSREIAESDISIRPLTLAVDVIFHRSVIDASFRSGGFKSQIVNLAFEWVMKETGVQFSYTWVDVKEKYVGGLGEDGDIPVLFFVNLDDHDTSMAALKAAASGVSGSGSSADNSRKGKDFSSSSKSSKSTKDELLSAPANLLRGIINNQNEGTIDQLATSTKPPPKKQSSSAIIATPATAAAARATEDQSRPLMTTTETNAKKDVKKAGSLIQDLSSPADVDASSRFSDSDVGQEVSASVGGSVNRSKKPAIKKGFLTGANSGKLYPTGSSEGAGGGKGGSFARVMDKCQIVNMGTGEVKMPASATSGAPATTKTVSFSEHEKQPASTVNSNSKPSEGGVNSGNRQTSSSSGLAAPIVPPKPLPSAFEIEEASRLLELMDDEYGRKAVGAMTEDSISNAFGDLAKLLLRPMPGVNDQLASSIPSANPFTSLSNATPATINATSTTSPSVGANVFVARNTLPNDYSVTTEMETTDDNSTAVQRHTKAVVRISGLVSSKFKVSSVDVNATSSEINIVIPATADSVSNGCHGSILATVNHGKLDPKSVIANYSKKKSVLTITATIV